MKRCRMIIICSLLLMVFSAVTGIYVISNRDSLSMSKNDYYIIHK
ncbi:MAG: hypothetical protein Q8930_16365 [Bacillota bacterium]|nr:hypothetical protein [Bacillota bacterium]